MEFKYQQIGGIQEVLKNSNSYFKLLLKNATVFYYVLTQLKERVYNLQRIGGRVSNNIIVLQSQLVQSEEFQREIKEMAFKYAKNIRKSPLVFTSSLQGANINRLVKLAVAMCFSIDCGIERTSEGCVFEYENYWE